MLHSHGERVTFSRTPRRVTLVCVRHRGRAAVPQKSLADGPAHPRSTFCHSKVHYSDVKETFNGSAGYLTRPSRSASPGGVTFCVRCNQLQPLSVQLRCLDAQPNRSQRARNARSNGEETKLNRHLARRPAPSTARLHLIQEFHAPTCGDASQRRSTDVDSKRDPGFKSLGVYFRGLLEKGQRRRRDFVTATQRNALRESERTDERSRKTFACRPRHLFIVVRHSFQLRDETCS